MLECVAGQSGVVHLNVHLEVLVKPVRAKEAYDGLRIHIVLMLDRFHRLGFDEERSLEPFGTGIVTSSLKHLGEMVFLPLRPGVEKTCVAFAASP